MHSVVQNKKVRQVGSLYVSMGLSTFLGLLISVINTRLLGPGQYGDLKFIQTIFQFFTVFMTLGLFVTGGRLLALKKNEPGRQTLIGNLLIIASCISILFIAIMFVFSFFEEQIFDNELGNLIRVLSPFVFVFPFQMCLEKIMEGSNSIYELSVFRIAPSVIYVASALLFNYFVPLSLASALAIQLLTLLATVAFFTWHFKPNFQDASQTITNIWRANKTHGLQSYIGLIFGVATGHLAGLSLAYYVDTTTVGIFSLALSIALPLTLLTSTVGTTYYKDFANRNSIPLKATVVTVSLSLSALVIFFLIIDKLFLLLYSEEYAAAIPIAYILAIGCVLHGFGDYVNRFLGAHGMGRLIRNGALVVGIVNIFGYSLLVKWFGIQGAGVTRVLAGLIYVSMMFFYYKNLKKELISNK